MTVNNVSNSTVWNNSQTPGRAQVKGAVKDNDGDNDGSVGAAGGAVRASSDEVGTKPASTGKAGKISVYA